MDRPVSAVKIVVAVAAASLIGAFFGQGAYDPTSGAIGGGISGALTGAGYSIFMQRLNAGRAGLLLYGTLAGSLCGLFSAVIAHLPSLIMGIKPGESIFAVSIQDGAVWGIVTGAILGAMLSVVFSPIKEG